MMHECYSGMMLMLVAVCFCACGPCAAESGPGPRVKIDEYGPLLEVEANGALFRFRLCNEGLLLTQVPPHLSSGGRVESIGEVDRRVEVAVPSRFWILDSEVTNQMWNRVMKEDDTQEEGLSKSPKVGVSYLDAIRFCQSLGRQVALGDVRLPSSLQWEYACRAGDSKWRADEEALSLMVGKPAPSGDRVYPVRLLKPNAWGIYDMLGNAHEICDEFDPGQTAFPEVYIRGGSVATAFSELGYCGKMTVLTEQRMPLNGFRCMLYASQRVDVALEVSMRESGINKAK